MGPVSFVAVPSFGHYSLPAKRGICVRLYGLPDGVQVQIRDRRFWYTNGNREGVWRHDLFLKALNNQLEKLGVGLKALSPLPGDTIYLVGLAAPDDRIEEESVFATLPTSRQNASWTIQLDFRKDGDGFAFVRGIRETVCKKEESWYPKTREEETR